jgi:protein-S-isoprenylcysteine O-methyltransferase Ste14
LEDRVNLHHGREMIGRVARTEGALMWLGRTTPRSQGEPRQGTSRYARWARREHSEPKRIAALVPLGPVFLGLLPFLVAGLGPRLDRRLGLEPIGIAPVNRVLGGLLTVLGFSLAFWSIDAQLGRGRGTPLPVMPTQELLTDGPFRYCRNPMTLGTILAYLGMAVAARTTTGTAIVISLAASLLVYLKRLEEGELAERFGESYLTYKRETPFIIPRLPRRW